MVSKVVAFLPNGHFPYGQLVRPLGHERMRTHAGGPGPRRGRFRAFHGEEINASCLHRPWARGKLPKPTSRVGQQADRTPLSRPPTLGTAAAGPVTPAGRVGGARRTPRDFFPGEKRWSVDAMALTGNVTRVRPAAGLRRNRLFITQGNHVPSSHRQIVTTFCARSEMAKTW